MPDAMPTHTPRDHDALIIGAGFAGMYTPTL